MPLGICLRQIGMLPLPVVVAGRDVGEVDISAAHEHKHLAGWRLAGGGMAEIEADGHVAQRTADGAACTVACPHWKNKLGGLWLGDAVQPAQKQTLVSQGSPYSASTILCCIAKASIASAVLQPCTVARACGSNLIFARSHL